MSNNDSKFCDRCFERAQLSTELLEEDVDPVCILMSAIEGDTERYPNFNDLETRKVVLEAGMNALGVHGEECEQRRVLYAKSIKLIQLSRLDMPKNVLLQQASNIGLTNDFESLAKLPEQVLRNILEIETIKSIFHFDGFNGIYKISEKLFMQDSSISPVLYNLARLAVRSEIDFDEYSNQVVSYYSQGNTQAPNILFYDDSEEVSALGEDEKLSVDLIIYSEKVKDIHKIPAIVNLSESIVNDLYTKKMMEQIQTILDTQEFEIDTSPFEDLKPTDEELKWLKDFDLDAEL